MSTIFIDVVRSDSARVDAQLLLGLKGDTGDSAYEYAVAHGYDGTEYEYGELMASYATVAEDAAESASEAAGSASDAATSASEAAASAVSASRSLESVEAIVPLVETSAQNAASSADSASQSAIVAAASASSAASASNSASQSANSASISATSAAGSAESASISAGDAESSAQSASQSAEDAASSAQTAEDARDTILGMTIVTDVEIDGSTIVTDGVADIPVATGSQYGTVKAGLSTVGSDTYSAVSLSFENGGSAKTYTLAQSGVASTTKRGLMSASDKTKLNSIAQGAEVNVQADWNVANASSDAYIKNKPTLFSGDYNDLENKPDIPSKTSDLDNDVPFATADDVFANTIIQTLTDTEPYSFRPTPSCGSLEYDEIVGASVGWNQLWKPSTARTVEQNGVHMTDNGDGSYTFYTDANGATAQTTIILKSDVDVIIASHVHFLSGFGNSSSENTWQIADGFNVALVYPIGKDSGIYKKTVGNTGLSRLDARLIVASGTIISSPITIKPNATDLTLAFGSTIADYVYSLETATAGAGVAWLRSHFPNLFGTYQPYDAGSIKSVSGLTAHVMRDSSDNIIGSYPLDSSVTLRGQYKLDANNQLYADGDVYPSSGEIGRNWGEVELGSLPWGYYGGLFSAQVPNFASPTAFLDRKEGFICSKYSTDTQVAISSDSMTDKSALRLAGSIYIKDTAYTDVTVFKQMLISNSVKLAFKLATPTTETATPYTNPQQVESGGTEEYVGAEIAVGHETQYPMTLGDTMPKADGTYTMSVTVSNGKRTISWT